MDNKETVCAVIVTYNRKELLIECLEGLLRQTRPIDAIYIIDNASTDKTPELLLEKGYIQELPPKELNEPWEKQFMFNNDLLLITEHKLPIFYVRMNENTGGAGGFYEGVKRAYEKDFDWLWLMDDDIEAKANALEELLKFKHISNCIHPIKKFTDGTVFNWNGYICNKYGIIINEKENFKDKNFCCINYGCFEGMLINRKIISKIGYPKKEFFLTGDDAYYGYLASLFTNVIYINKAEFLKKIKKTKKSKLYIYYVNRNFTYFLMTISKRKIITFLYRFYIAIYFSIKYKTFASLNGFIDGIRGKFDLYNN